ncbi:MAG: hypothetical protein J0G94_11525, partial [Sphingomonadales bacterium]|nr:hypothetical protein [Sphingomonadales bacterium]
MTVIATALKHMLAAGMPHEAIIAAVEEMEVGLVAAQPEKVRSKGALRTERYRERMRHKASQSVTCDDETSQRHATPLSPAPLLSPQTPQITPHPHTP